MTDVMERIRHSSISAAAVLSVLALAGFAISGCSSKQVDAENLEGKWEVANADESMSHYEGITLTLNPPEAGTDKKGETTVRKATLKKGMGTFTGVWVTKADKLRLNLDKQVGSDTLKMQFAVKEVDPDKGTMTLARPDGTLEMKRTEQL